MHTTTIGLDIAKRVFQVHGADCTGRALLRRRLQRSEVLAFFKSLPGCLVGIEACATAHHPARVIRVPRRPLFFPSSGPIPSRLDVVASPVERWPAIAVDV